MTGNSNRYTLPSVTQAPILNLIHLTEAELLEREFTTSDPESLENVSNEPPPIDEEAQVESGYNVTARGWMVRCVFCKHPNHFHGIVVRYEPSGTRRLVGRDCALKHFGVEFKQKLIDFDAAADRQSYVRRRRSFLAASGKLVDEFRELRGHPAVQIFETLMRMWRDGFPELSRDITEIAKRGEMLAIEREVRDEAAERERKHRLGDRFESEKQAAKAAGRRWQITKTVRENVGAIAGPLFFLPGISVARRLDDIQLAVQNKIAFLSRDDLMVSQIKVAFRELSELRNQVSVEFERLYHLQAAFSPDNLARIAKWANGKAREVEKQFVSHAERSPSIADRYLTKDSCISDSAILSAKAELPFYRVPKRVLVDVFSEAISTEWEPDSRRQLSA